MTGVRRPAGCRDRLAQLFDYIDGELSPSRVRALEAHLRRCTCCGTLEHELRRSIAACRAAGKSRLPKDVRLRAQQRVRDFLNRHREP